MRLFQKFRSHVNTPNAPTKPGSYLASGPQGRHTTSNSSDVEHAVESTQREQLETPSQPNVARFPGTEGWNTNHAEIAPNKRAA